VVRPSRREVAAVVLLLALSLVLRLRDLDALVVSDEMRWTCRSLGFQDALLSRDWDRTFRVGHPGVVTTWLGSLSIPRADTSVSSRALVTCQMTDDAKRLNEAGRTSRELSERIRDLSPPLFSGRVGIALFTWLSLIPIYGLARLLWGPDIGVVSLFLTALSPFYLAHSRFLHVDAVLTSLMSLSLLLLLTALRRRATAGRVPFILLSGALGGLAAVQKSPAMFLAPFTVLVVAIDVLRQRAEREPMVQALRDVSLWGAAALAVYVAAWPAVWVAPVETIQSVVQKAVGYAEEGHTLGNYFMGRPVLDPGWSFYPLAILFRLSPLTTIGLLAGLGWWMRAKKRRDERFGVLVMLLYVVLFGIFMSLGAKKFDRYILPVFPAVELTAGFGLVWLVSDLGERSRGRFASWIPAAGLLAALIVSLALVLPHQPHYLTYYNPLLGGTARAKDALLLGWGEGYEEIVPYLNEKENAEELQVAVTRFSGFAPVFRGEPRSMLSYSTWETDYVVIYVGQVQRRRYEWLLEEYHYDPDVEPEHVITLQGVDYAWIYRNDHYVDPMAYLDQEAEPDAGDCLLVNSNSLFAAHYDGALPVLTFEGRWNPAEESHSYWGRERLAGMLDEAGGGCRQIWYARYPEYEPDTYVRVLESRGLLQAQVEFPHMELLQYRFVEPRVEKELDLEFEGLRLVGYGVTDPLPAWGRDGGLFMVWEATQFLNQDYSTFLHLYDARGQRVAQGDSLIVDQTYEPTSQWSPGDRKESLYHLPVPPGTPPGVYDLELGVYELDTGKRLPLVGGDVDGQGKSARLEVRIGTAHRPVPLENLDMAHDVHQLLAPGLRLAGYDLESDTVAVGAELTLRLTWEAVRGLDQDWRLELGLKDSGGREVASFRMDVVETAYPTSDWEAGEVIQEWYYLPVTGTLPTGEMTVTLDLLDADGDSFLDQPVPITSVWIQTTEPPLEVPKALIDPPVADLGERLTLLTYTVPASVRAGQDLPLTVYWQAQRQITESYKAFVHLYDEQGNIVAQQDRIPGLGIRPTTSWEEGEVVGDRLHVPIDASLRTGSYRLAIGLYDQETGARLEAIRPSGEPWEDDRIMLKRVEVEP